MERRDNKAALRALLTENTRRSRLLASIPPPPAFAVFRSSLSLFIVSVAIIFTLPISVHDNCSTKKIVEDRGRAPANLGNVPDARLRSESRGLRESCASFMQRHCLFKKRFFRVPWPEFPCWVTGRDSRNISGSADAREIFAMKNSICRGKPHRSYCSKVRECSDCI